jgi:3-hydroxybutyryl-CoA dehydratase
MTAVAKWTLQEIREGQDYAFEAVISASNVDSFGALVGDENPLHMDAEFARRRGFDNRVVHGAFLFGLASRLVGMYLPGRDCIIHETRLKFPAPAYVGDRVLVRGVVEQVSEGAHAAVIGLTISRVATARALATGKVIVGFTKEEDAGKPGSLGNP